MSASALSMAGGEFGFYLLRLLYFTTLVSINLVFIMNLFHWVQVNNYQRRSLVPVR